MSSCKQSKNLVKKILLTGAVISVLLSTSLSYVKAASSPAYPATNWLTSWTSHIETDVEDYITSNNIISDSDYEDIMKKFDNKVTADSNAAVLKEAETHLVLDGSSSVTLNDFYSGNILYWAPANTVGDADLGWGAGRVDDYVVVLYNDTNFIVALVKSSTTDGKLDNIEEQDDILAAKKIEFDSLKGEDFEFLNWVRAQIGSSAGDSIMTYVRFSSYYADKEFLLDHNNSYAKNRVVQNNVIDKLKKVTTNYQNNVNSESLFTIECLLRILGDTYVSDADKTLVNNDVSKLYFDSYWSDDYDRVNLHLVKDTTDISIKAKNSTTDIDLKTLYIYLLQASKDTSLPKDYAVVTNLSKVIANISQTIAEDAEDSANEGAIENITSGEVVNKTAFEKWVDTASSFIVTQGKATKVVDGSGNVINGYQNYDLDKFSEITNMYINNNSSGQKDTLNSEEILRLRAYMHAASKLTTIARPLMPESCAYPVSGYNEITINTGGYNTSDVKALAESMVAKFEGKNNGIKTTRNIVENLDSIVKYNSARLYGYQTGNPFEEQDEEDLSILSSSPFLNSITPGIEDVVTTLTYGYYITPMTKMQRIVGTKDAYDAYLQLNYLLMIAASYAENDSKLTLNSAGEYENTQLTEFINNAGANQLTVDTSAVASQISAYIAIYRAFDYLGVTPFTKQLTAICNYYNSIISFEGNQSYQNYNPSEQEGEALAQFFSIKEHAFSENYKIGVALSSTFIPLETNLYNTSSLGYLDDETWVQKFHYPFGFYRKALYIDTDINAAVVYYNTNGNKGTQRIATLGDLLQTERDIVLYIDNNFYNVDKLAEMQGYSYTKLANTEEAGEDGTNTFTENISDWWAEFTDTNIESVVKTGAVSTYSKNIKRDVSEYDSGENKGTDYVLSDKSIRKYLTGYSENSYDVVYDEYTPLQSYAVVSGIYRQTSLYNIVWDEVLKESPVFISSPNLAAIAGVELKQYNTIFNYLMLKNLKGSLGVDYKTTLDLDSPIYMDIYGNIVTESGLVVIPAVSNATLCEENIYNVYNAGFLNLYNNGIYELPADYINSDKYMTSMFEVNEETQTWQIRNKRIANIEMNFKDIPLKRKDVVNTLKYIATENLEGNYLPFEHRVWLITEVLRGAPVEDINKEFEGIEGVSNINKYGIYFAYKLDEIADQLLSTTNGNSLITLPNLAFMTGFEYVILFAFKITFAALFALLFVKVYIDATQSKIGIKTVGSFVISIIMFLVSAFTIPTLMDISYYQVNKQLLANEVQYIEFLNLEKKNQGREIGVYEVTEPETQTELYVKIDDLTIPWYEIVDDILFSSTFDTVSDVYAEKFDSSLMSSLPGVQKKGNSLYMSIDDIFESTSIEYLVDNNALYSNVTTTPYASYILPYYVILDEMIARVNYYNKENNIQDFTTTIQSKGAVKTLGMIEPYFTSEYFMSTSLDVTGMRYINGVETVLTETHAVFDTADFDAMKNSLWYKGDSDPGYVTVKLEELDEYARAFVANNKSLLGKVSDDTFLKVMSISLAVKYNNIMGISSGNAVEIYNVDSRDLLRLSLADKETVLTDSSKSFARFVYTNGGTIGVLFASILLGVYFLVSVLKPLCIFVIIGSTIASVVIRRLIKKDKTKSIEGFLITIAILCGINLLYGVLLKVLMIIPDLGVTFVVAALLQIVLQLVYVGSLVFFTSLVLSDWKDFGFNRYQQMAYRLGIMSVNEAKLTISKAFATLEGNFEGNTTVDGSKQSKRFNSRNKNKPSSRSIGGANILEAMKRKDERREGNYGKR